jgi:pyrroline-5-carboxylate reductase
MGEAIISAVLRNDIAAPEEISVSEIDEKRAEYLRQKYNVQAGNLGRRVTDESNDIIVLAIKPQQLADVMAGLRGAFKPSQLVVSIIAGVKIDTISRGLAHKCIVRVMPNTPAQIGYGMSAWTATDTVTEAQRKEARSILAAMGKEMYFPGEEYLDMVTAVSGSGPAYFFLMAEALIDGAVKIGLSREEAGVLVVQTMLGSAHLLEQSGKEAAELRRNVTSKGGTTERALGVFEAGGFAQLVAEAVNAAYNRAKELGG